MYPVKYVLVAVYLDGSGELELFRWCRDALSGMNRARREGIETFGADWVKGVRIEARPVPVAVERFNPAAWAQNDFNV